MALVLDGLGRALGDLPANAVQIHSGDTSMVSLVGLWIDPDGIVYNPDGTVNEAATALAARAQVTAQTSAQYGGPAPGVVEKQSVQAQSEADATRMYLDSQVDAVFNTAAEIPGRVVDAVKVTGGIGALIGLGVLAVLVLEHLPQARERVRIVRRRAGGHVRRLARAVEGG